MFEIAFLIALAVISALAICAIAVAIIEVLKTDTRWRD